MRAGLIEQWVIDLLIKTGLGERMQREALFHDGTNLSFDGKLHHIDFRKLVGRGVAIYGQQEIVKDLIARRLADGGQILFDAEAIEIKDIESERPKIQFKQGDKAQTIDCDFIAGCDGFHGICRPAVEKVLQMFDREYPFGWLGILADAPPVNDELIYAYHERGFAFFAMRSEQVVRYYLQCKPDEDLAQWPDDRIWDELSVRLGGEAATRLTRGPITQKGVTPMRSFVCEPMQHGPAVPRRRRRAYRAADRRQGNESRTGRCLRALARDRAFLQIAPQRPARKLFGDMPAARVEGAALLVVDDADAASLRRRRKISTCGGNWPNSIMSRARKPPRARWPRIIPACRCRVCDARR